MHVVIRSFLRKLLLAALLGGLLCTPATPTQAQASPTWRLLNANQTICFDSNATANYYGVWIKGRWAHAITVGLVSLPTGSTQTPSYTPIPPGSSNGVGSLAYVEAQIPAHTTPATYVAGLVATDGTVWETVPVTLDVMTSCGY